MKKLATLLICILSLLMPSNLGTVAMLSATVM